MGAEGLNEELFEEYDVLTIEVNGKDVEFAIVDEFDLEDKHYILWSEVVDDEVNEEDVYLFEAKVYGEEIEVNQIPTEEEYNRIAEEYYKLFEE